MMTAPLEDERSCIPYLPTYPAISKATPRSIWMGQQYRYHTHTIEILSTWQPVPKGEGAEGVLGEETGRR